MITLVNQAGLVIRFDYQEWRPALLPEIKWTHPAYMSNYYQPTTDLRFIQPTLEEEQELFRRMHAGDIEARDAIVRNHLLFVANVARKAANGRFDDDEIVSTANEALMLAVESKKFDYKRGNRFTSYLRPFIKGAISRMHKDRSKYVALPENPEAPVPGQLPSVETEVDHATEISDFTQFVSDALAECRGKLTEQEQQVIILAYEQGLNHAQIGRQLKLTRERIRQVHASAIDKLRKAMVRRGISSR